MCWDRFSRMSTSVRGCTHSALIPHYQARAEFGNAYEVPCGLYQGLIERLNLHERRDAHKRHLSLPQVPIIVLSGRGNERDRSSHLSHPIVVHQVFPHIRRSRRELI